MENTNTTTTVAPTAAAIVNQAPESKGARQCKPVDYGRVRALYNAGWTDKQIIDELNISIASMCTWRKNNNLPPNKQKAAVKTAVRENIEEEARQEEINSERMLALREQGMNVKQIANELGVTESFVNWYFDIMGQSQKSLRPADENIEQIDTVEEKIQTTLDTPKHTDVTRLIELTFDLLKTVWERIA